jgi:hypothetical protein
VKENKKAIESDSQKHTDLYFSMKLYEMLAPEIINITQSTEKLITDNIRYMNKATFSIIKNTKQRSVLHG